MKRLLTQILLSLALIFAVSLIARETLAQQRTAAAPSMSAKTNAPVDVDRIVRAFTVKEAEFRKALTQYSFKREVVIQTIGLGGEIAGEYHRVSTFTFDDSGNRYEKINFFPLPTLKEVSISPQDLEDLDGVLQFALENSKANQYNFTYAGKERIDELNLYVFDVAPKVLPDPKKTKERFFQGRIWVDDQDLQVVKVHGKGVPETKDDKHPSFETYREQIDNKYWFPTYTYTDENIVFDNGQTVHVRARLRFTDYVRGKGTLRVIEDDETPSAKPTPAPSKKVKP